MLLKSVVSSLSSLHSTTVLSFAGLCTDLFYLKWPIFCIFMVLLISQQLLLSQTFTSHLLLKQNSHMVNLMSCYGHWHTPWLAISPTCSQLHWAAPRTTEMLDLATAVGEGSGVTVSTVEHCWSHSETFYTASFPHSRFASPALALSLHKRRGSVSEPWFSLHSPRASLAVDRMEYETAQAAHINALSLNYRSVCIF